MDSKQENNKRMAKNTIALYLRTAVATIISLYMARVLMDTLGAEDYGIYSVVGSIVITFSFFNSTLTSAIQRFMTFAIGKNDIHQLTKVYSMSLIILMFLALIIILVCEIGGLWYINNKLNIPQERLNAAFWVFQFSLLTFVFGVMRIVFESLVISHEKLTFYAYLSIIEACIKLATAYMLYHTASDKLIFYASLVSVVAAVSYFAYFFYCRFSFRNCKFHLSWDPKLFKELFSFSGWSFLGSTTSLCTQQVFILLINNAYGIIANAAMGIATNVSNSVYSFVAGFCTSFRPQIIKSYAKDDYNYYHRLIEITSKISFLLIFTPALLMIINSPLILELWLKNVPEYTVQFTRLILVCCIIDGISNPYNTGIMASGKIRNYQIAISIVFCLDIIFTLYLFSINVPAQYILFSRIATRGVMNLFVGLYYLKKQTSFNSMNYIRKTLSKILLLVVLTIPILILLLKSHSSITLFVYSVLIVALIVFPLSLLILFNSEERKYILSLINKLKK
jgi:O-antigen/teichoic acid export membrane protein